jgi:4-amino-4-deoxy-L-arabinose transferase-like glycosyltransferase
MSMSWRDFFFGAFDPAGTISLDKLPGAFWVQALSVRIFGLHTWSIVLPQVIEGTFSILVLFRLVRRLCGPAAGLLAAFLLAVSPANVALNRGNIADTLMIFLLLLAADSLVSAISSNRWSSLLLAGLWVGLAFQAKMLEAWLVLPALWLVLVVGEHGRWTRRLLRIGVLTIVVAIVSVSWMTMVTLTPSSSRPYADGSPDNSVFSQVFVYNGFGRVDQASPDQLLNHSIGLEIPLPPPPAWNRLLTGSLGRDEGWLIPVAIVSLVGGLIATRRRPRYDLERINFLLWGTWFFALALVFSIGSSLNSYYVAALSPALAGLVAGASIIAWRARHSIWIKIALGAAVIATVAYAEWLLPSSGVGVGSWLKPGLFFLGGLTLLGCMISIWRTTSLRANSLGAIGSLATVLIVPLIASVTIAWNSLGSFDTPFEPASVSIGVRALFSTSLTSEQLPELERIRDGAPYLMATETSALAAPFIFESGQEVLPIGGFTGKSPEPSLSKLKDWIGEGRFHLVLQSPVSSDPRYAWIARHCTPLPQPAGSNSPIALAIYYCLPTSLASN